VRAKGEQLGRSIGGWLGFGGAEKMSCVAARHCVAVLLCCYEVERLWRLEA
jgi:hypothetical protein